MKKIGKWDYFMAKLKKGPPLIRGPIERAKRQPAEQEVLTPHTEKAGLTPVTHG